MQTLRHLLAMIITIAALFASATGASAAFEGARTTAASDIASLADDYRSFYTDRTTYLSLGRVFALGAVMANTNVDVEVQDFYREHLRSGVTDEISDVVRVGGDMFVAIPAVITLRLVVAPESPVGRWAGYSTRAYLLGGPLGLALQRATGASRPEERSSGWRPFMDNNGVSGHSFVGSVPFLCAYRMTDNRYLKAAFLAASTLPALSRINDDKHYASQAVLGWYLGYISVKTVFRGDAGSGFLHHPGTEATLIPVVFDGSAPGLQLNIRF